MTHSQKLKAFNRRLSHAIRNIKLAKGASFQVIAEARLKEAKDAIDDALSMWK